MGVATGLLRSPRARADDGGFLELWRGMGEGRREATAGGRESKRELLLPATGGIFPLTGVGTGCVCSTPPPTSFDQLRKTPTTGGRPSPRWEIGPDTRVGRPRGAGLRWATTAPQLYRGALLVGDAAGMVNPFNGEGASATRSRPRLRRGGGRAALRSRSRARCGPTTRGGQGVGRLLHPRPDFRGAGGQPDDHAPVRARGMTRRALMQFVSAYGAPGDRRAADATIAWCTRCRGGAASERSSQLALDPSDHAVGWCPHRSPHHRPIPTAAPATRGGSRRAR